MKLCNKKPSLTARILISLLIISAGGLFVFLMLRYDPINANERPLHVFCAFNRVTGLYCPGCGMMRSAYSLFNFNVLDAIRSNALIVFVIGPLVGYLLLREFLRFLTQREILPFLKLKTWMIVAIVVIITLFSILRNIPGVPFCYLAPPT